MKKVILSIAFGLGVAGNLVAMQLENKPVASEPMVRITTSDNQEYAIALSVVRKIPVLKTMLEDIDEKHQAVAIPLANVDGDSFAIIKDLLGKKDENQITVEDFKNISSDLVIGLVKAIEYLNLETFKKKLFEVLNRRNLSEVQLNAMGGVLFKQFWLQHPALYALNQAQLIADLELGIDIESLDLRDDLKKLFTLLEDQTLKVWNTDNLEEIMGFDHVIEFDISADGTLLILTKQAQGNQLEVQQYNHHQQGNNSFLEVRKINDLGKALYRIPFFKGSFFVSPDTTKLIGVSKRNIKVWDVKDGKEVFTLENPRVINTKVSSNGKQLITWFFKSIQESVPEGRAQIKVEIELRNMNNLNKLVHKFEALIDYEINDKEEIIRITFDDDNLILFSSLDGKATIWDMHNLADQPQIIEFLDGVLDVSLLDNQRLLAKINDSRIEILNINTEKKLNELEGYMSMNVMSKDESKLLVKRPIDGLDESIFSVWDSNNGTLTSLPGFEIEEAVFDLEGRRLISWFNVNSSESEESDDDAQAGVVTIWDLYAPNNPIQRLNNLSEIQQFDLSERAMFIIMGNSIQLWNLDAMKDRLENLTLEQIKFLIRIYEGRDTDDGKLSVYESLPSDIKQIVGSVFPFVKNNHSEAIYKN
jgi:WD40 repeat protein